MLKRIYEAVVKGQFKKHRQMAFLAGPRQVGKTTIALDVLESRPDSSYFNWDKQTDRELFIAGPDAISEKANLNTAHHELPVVVFDELHKYGKWKTFLKGFYDTYESKSKVIVTGSARLDIYKAGGDSLMGRYFPYRIHPLSVAEVIDPTPRNAEINFTPKKVSNQLFEHLYLFGGFPEPFLKAETAFYNRWKRLRLQQLFQEDLRDLTRIQELGQMQLLADLLKYQAGQLTSYTSLAKKVNASVDTVKRWINTLKSFYYCFSVSPWSKNITRSLLKEPKYYLWDWSLIEDEGAKIENFVASHLHKAVNYWTDLGFGEYGLYFLRDKEQREVDFLVTKNETPWFLVEVKKSSNGSIVPELYYYQKQTQASHAFQVAFELKEVEVNCFDFNEPTIIPAKTFLAQLI